MKVLLSAIFVLLFLCVSAQDKIELSNQLEVIPPLKTINKAFDLKKGEVILLSVTPMRGKLSKITVETPGTIFSQITRKVTMIDRQSIPITNDGTYIFKFRNGSFAKKEVNIKITKKRRTVDKDTTILDDMIFSSFIDTVKKYKDDTLPVPDVSEFEFTLSPSFSYGTDGDSTIREPLIDNTTYQYAAYWVGIGSQAIDDYNALKNSPPPSWLIAGVNEPIMAYGLGLTKALPMSYSSIARQVMFKFMDPRIEKVPRLTRKDKRANFFDIIPVGSASKYDELVLSLRNFNTTSSVPVYIKIVKFKIDRQYYNQYIIRERVQEVFKEKTVKVLAPEEE